MDGVLTDGGIVYGTGGLEIKHFHVRDGSGLKVWNQAGRHSAIITGRSSPLVDVRAAELGVALCISRGVGQAAGVQAAAGGGRIASIGGLLCRR